MHRSELDVQRSFIGWLAQQLGYRERLSDPNGGAGPLMDSLGEINNRAVLIEFKYRLDASGVCYSLERTTSLERKIKSTLERLYADSLDGMPTPKVPPLVHVVAAWMADDARIGLGDMLERRAKDWWFDYDFGEQQGEEYVSLGRGGHGRKGEFDPCSIVFPVMTPAKERRRPRSTRAELIEAATSRQVGEELRLFLELAKQSGCVERFNRANVMLAARSRQTGRLINLLGVWPEDSSATDGLLVTVSPDRLDESGMMGGAGLEAMQFRPAPPKGYLGESVYLKGEQEIRAFWRAVVAARTVEQAPGSSRR